MFLMFKLPSTSFWCDWKLKRVDFVHKACAIYKHSGFAANGNTRFVQLIDGIDNQAPD